ncbi:hypothetical protein [Victivallis sp. Marseille-Q1083]|uniref:hypothetical protein n=1 Tax=Victivallis sp. Marseille-Q1083 TaxID=2717288 RepID=UPI00158C26AC|nr:hypothetical protein [Victivallis sp. Marseille-Q1083]
MQKIRIINAGRMARFSMKPAQNARRPGPAAGTAGRQEAARVGFRSQKQLLW